MADIDPNIEAILRQHQSQLDLIKQHQDRDNRIQNERLQSSIKDKFLKTQKEKVGLCDGNNLKQVRIWSRNIFATINRVPQGQNAEDYVIELIKETATGDLLDEVEAFMQAEATAMRAATVQSIRTHVNNTFLGPDEANQLKDKVRDIKQSAREDIPAFNRRFAKAADMGYPAPRQDTEEQIVLEMYMAALANGRIKDRVFNQDPPTDTLAATMQVAADEYARQQRRHRVTREFNRVEVDMEVDEAAPSDPPLRDTLAAMASAIRGIQQNQDNAANTRGNAAEAKGNGRDNGHHRGKSNKRCWYCNRLGHIQRFCRKRQADLQGKEKGGPSSSSPSSSRNGNGNGNSNGNGHRKN